MTAAEFKKKWGRYTGKESSGYQDHFNDLCRLLKQQTPVEADPTGSDLFCFQKRVVKDAEIFDLSEAKDAPAPTERGFADVWKKGCFAWEYKGKKKNLNDAYKQLLRYRESLLNPPLLVVCDFDRYIVRTNFNGTVQEVYEFTNDQIDEPRNLRVLRALFANPEQLKPVETTDKVTEALAGQIAEIARSLQSRESVELADAKNRREVNVAQKTNLRIARFLNRIVFCFFAEDTDLLPEGLFTQLAYQGLKDPALFTQALEELFRVMATGGLYGHHKIRHFNGHLFEEATVFELTEEEIKKLAEAAERDWQFIQPAIMGTLFERALDESQRAQLGAHYTSEADIKTLVEPVLMQPFRREWAEIKGELAIAYAKGKGTPAQRERLATFQKKLSTVTVLDPACGSGNFLYVSLQLLLGLEKEVITFATQMGYSFKPQVSVQQLKAIEINPYAFELAQVSVQIGYLQWRRDNGFDNDRTPVLQVLDGFENEDALLRVTYRKIPKNLKEARDLEDEGVSPFQLRAFYEKRWPECDIIVGNPPWLGDKLMRRELGDEYVQELRKIYARIPGQSDLCCYWFEKARDLIEHRKCKRAGLLATQGIRGGSNREVLTRIKETGDIFFAVSDREWVLKGANVHGSMVGFDSGVEKIKILDDEIVPSIESNLWDNKALTETKILKANSETCFLGVMKAGAFDIDESSAKAMLLAANNRWLPNSDVLRPRFTARDILQRTGGGWIIDFGYDSENNFAEKFRAPYKHIYAHVKPERMQNRRKSLAKYWWLHGEPRPGMRNALTGLHRFIVTPEVSKHRIFVWMDAVNLADHQTRVFARSDSYFFGVLQSRIHEVWALAQGTQLRDKESGFRYTPTSCFETFPFAFPDDLQQPKIPDRKTAPTVTVDPDWDEYMAKKFNTVNEDAPAFYHGPGSRELNPAEHRSAIGAAAKELNELREGWLNPPEWTVEKVLTFPGSVKGPWARYVTKPDKHGIGTVRYPRLEPRNADCAAELKERTLTNLYNERPAWLDLAHKKLDAAVADAYGWPADLTDEQILEKLLALNLERAAEEAKAAQTSKPRISRPKRDDELI
jgi:type II restriction/modification system DNA methylase subunit YeeA